MKLYFISLLFQIKKAHLIIVLSLFISFALHAQYHDIAPQVTFAGKLNAPIKVEVKKNDDGFLFTAKNSSLFPYQLELSFMELSNLSPTMSSYKTILQPGNNRLFTLKIDDKESAYNYQYSVQYRMGNPKQKADKGFPYLIPLGEGKKVEYLTNTKDNRKTVLIDFFKTMPGDTIFAARRGFVTVTPGTDIELDRINNDASLEIRHNDGTVAVYSGINPAKTFAKIGHKVYAGQAIGIIDDKLLRLNVYEFLGQGSLRSVNLLYANKSPDQLKTAMDIRDKIVQHPEEIIIREMTKREIKKMNKGILY